MKQNIWNLSQKHTILASVLLLIIISLIIIVVVTNNEPKEVALQNIENIYNEEAVLINEEIIEYVDISELEQNITVEESNTNNENAKNNNDSNKITGGTLYYIKVNYGAQVVTIYKKDSDGNYTVPVKAMVCSTGVATPKSGVYKIPYRYRWLGLQGDVYGQYCTQVVGNILFHSVPYLERGNPGSLEYWEYDKLGTYASAGCIRLTVADAIWIYNNCEKGTQVEFYSSSNPGPLGKPAAKKISNFAGNLKNWDPTDPDPNNPWKNYKIEQNNNTNSNTNTNTNTNTSTGLNNNIQVNENKEIYTNEESNDKVNNQTNTNVTVNESITNNTQINENQINKGNEVIVNDVEKENTVL